MRFIRIEVVGMHTSYDTLLDDQFHLGVSIRGVVLVVESLKGGDVPPVVFRDLLSISILVL